MNDIKSLTATESYASYTIGKKAFLSPMFGLGCVAGLPKTITNMFNKTANHELSVTKMQPESHNLAQNSLGLAAGAGYLGGVTNVTNPVIAAWLPASAVTDAFENEDGINFCAFKAGYNMTP